MQNQTNKLWRKIGLQKNFLQGTSHSDSSKNTRLSESFTKQGQQFQEDVKNTSFLKYKNQLSQKQAQHNQPKNHIKQSQIKCIESQQGFDTSIEELLSQQKIIKKYSLLKRAQIINIDQTSIQIDENCFSPQEPNIQNNNKIGIQSSFSKQTKNKDNKIKGKKQHNENNSIIVILNSFNEFNQIKSKQEQCKERKESKQDRIERQQYEKQRVIIKLQEKVRILRSNLKSKVQQQSKELREQYEAFRGQVRMQLNRMLSYLKHTIQEQFQQHLNQLNDEIGYLYSQNQQFISKIQDKQITLKKLSEQNALLSSKVDEIKQFREQQLREKKQKISRLQNEINILQQKLQDLEEVQNQKESLKNQLKQLLTQINTYQLNHSLHTEKINTYQLNHSIQTDKIKQLSQQSSSYQLKIQSLQQEITQFKNQNQLLSTQISSLSIIQSQNQYNQQNIIKANQQLQTQIKLIQNEKNILLKSISKLQNQSNQNQNQSKQFEKQSKQFEKQSKQFEKQSKQLKNQNQQLQEKRETFKEQKEEFDNQRKKIFEKIGQQENQREKFEKQRKQLLKCEKQLFRIKQQCREIIQMGQLLQSLLNESLRHNTIEIVNNIEKEYNIKQYQTLYTMFSFIKQEIHHNNFNNPLQYPSLINKQQQIQHKPQQFKNHLQNIPKNSPKNSSSDTINKQSSKNLLRSTGYFGEVGESKPICLSVRLDDIQKNYSTQIAQQSQSQTHHYKNKTNSIKTNSNKTNQNLVSNFSELDNKIIDLNVKIKNNLKDQKSNNSNEKRGNDFNDNKNNNFNDKKSNHLNDKVEQSLKKQHQYFIKNKQQTYFNTNNQNIKPKQKQSYNLPINKPSILNHKRHQSMQFNKMVDQQFGVVGLYNKKGDYRYEDNFNEYQDDFGQNLDLEDVNENNVSSQISEDLQIVKSAFQYMKQECNQNDTSHNDRKNKQYLKIRNSNEKHFRNSTNPNYSFSEHNSIQAKQLQKQKHTFHNDFYKDQQQNDFFEDQQQNDFYKDQQQYENQSNYTRNKNRNYTNYPNNRQSKNTQTYNNTQWIDNKNQNISKTQSRMYHQRQNIKINQKNIKQNHQIIKDNRRQKQKINEENINVSFISSSSNNNEYEKYHNNIHNFNDYEKYHNHDNEYEKYHSRVERGDIIEKIKERVKQKLKNSQQKNKSTYQNHSQSLIKTHRQSSSIQSHRQGLMKNKRQASSIQSYRQGIIKNNEYPLIEDNQFCSYKSQLTPRSQYTHQTAINQSININRNQTNNSENINNIRTTDYYSKHRNIANTHNKSTINPHHNITVNPHHNIIINPNNKSTINQKSLSPSNYSATRSPSNIRSRSPSNSSSVTAKLSNQYPNTTAINNKNINLSTSFRSGFSKSLIQKPQFIAYSRKTTQVAQTNMGATYQPKGSSYSIRNQQMGTGSFMKKY